MSSPLLLGVLAGLAVALPVGPVGVLLLRTGLVDGVRVAVGAACGIATVDLAYAVVAVAVGTPVSRLLDAHAALVRGLGAVVLVIVGVAGLVGSVRAARRPPPETRPSAGPSTLGAYVRFVGLTAINPLTALTFTTVAVGLALGVAGTASVLAFVVGAGVASLAWQLLLAVGSGVFGQRLPLRARVVVSAVGAGAVVLAGVALLV
ncbi:LysE family transporter [Cellulomonas humilata]|uniref:LysE family transporter n=1 Tax=Cellulomonas humilata TaxID=144055 RepID=A0A7Y6E008_9CELL|nr:LysE family transporter [Cellulomonas humilata]NUU19584.1 LysE family transporter [Cellulomonas humilata]